MFFSQLKSSTNPNHPSNSKNNVVKSVTKVQELPVKSKVVKKTKSKSRSATPQLQQIKSHSVSSPKSPKTPKTPVVHSRDVTATPEPTIDDERVLFKIPQSTVSGGISAAQMVAGSKQFKDIFSEPVTFTVELPYGQEEYSASVPVKDDDFDSIEELTSTVMTNVGKLCGKLEEIRDPDMKDCIVRRMKKAIKQGDKENFLESVEEYNSLVKRARSSNEFDLGSRLQFDFISDLLNQVYSRTVSPYVHDLRNYRAFSNNVYGELLPRFMSKVFKHTGLTSQKVFVDLGSGVGNCVLQASLEIGCESWGCEMMETASKLAADQKRDFEPRAARYGINTGKIVLRSNDFTSDPEILKVLPRADVLLVNNYAFDAELNEKLVNMFLDLKDGCQIVSLKSFGSANNANSLLSILSVEQKHFASDSVSWTNAPGVYYISTIDRSRIQDYY